VNNEDRLAHFIIVLGCLIALGIGFIMGSCERSCNSRDPDQTIPLKIKELNRRVNEHDSYIRGIQKLILEDREHDLNKCEREKDE
jgi:hypothetical protein